ncbi:putative MFS family arabinose efflux permease [Arcicella aurantiaca]|uniref:Putative MFS family arabinose efflux permease n=1 Tax=Arcicella aurantiaca TaxID=591202 RepID=A0A316EA09_9BACT|nr:MFS transporter [Arcicella aurantiaca]PWK26412.1 putative MFS family arabinose efflux permease [Arcicella aurantiaca]
MTKDQKIILYLLACVQFTNIMDFMIMMPMGPIIMKEFSLTAREYSFLVSAYSISAGVCGFIAAFFVDKFDRKNVLTIAYIGLLVGTLACAVAPTYQMLMVARIIAGVFGGVLGSQVIAIAGDITSYEHRAEGLAIIMAAFSTASVLGVPLGLYLASTISWHIPFVFIVAVGSVNLILIYKYLPNLTSHISTSLTKPSPLAILTNIGKDSNQIKALLLSVIVIFGHFCTIPSLSPYLTINVGMSVDNVSLIYLIGGGVTIVSARIVGKLADKKGKYLVFAICGTLFLIPVYLMTNLYTGASLVVILSITTLFFLFANGRTLTMQAIVSGVVDNEQRGGFTSISSSMVQLGSGAASFVGGLIVQKAADGTLLHYEWVGYLSITFMIIGIILGKYVKPYGS